MLLITRHAAKRLRKRMGLNRRSLQRFVNRAERDGMVTESTGKADYFLVHAGAVLVVRDQHVLTAYPINTAHEPETYA